MQKNKPFTTSVIRAGICFLGFSLAYTSAFAEDDENVENANVAVKSPWKFGGAIRGAYQYVNYNKDRKGELEFDTLRGEIGYDDGSIIGSGQLRYYHYSKRQTGGDSGNMVLLNHLWAGYRFSDKSELIAGLNSHPFGLYPYAGNNFFESMAYYAGFEDTQSLGIKYSRKDGAFDTQLAFYPSDGGHGSTSDTKSNFLEDDSARYSFHLVNEHQEKNTGIARVTYSMEHSNEVKSEFGLSYLHGEVGSTINQSGHRDAVAAHYAGVFGKAAVRLMAMQYNYNLNGSPTTLAVGGFGFSNKLATEGEIYVANVSYNIGGSIGPFSGFTVYNEYSSLIKHESGFTDSSQNVTGLSFGAGKVWIYADYMLGKNSTYMSPVFYNGMGAGKATDNNGQRLNVSVGYYF
jgi:hypothetical protein